MGKSAPVRVEGDQDSEFFRMGRKELKAIASGKASKRQAAAQAEVDRRANNKAVKAAAAA